MSDHLSKKETFIFALQGFLPGIIILFGAILVELFAQNLDFSITSLVQIHKKNPRMWLFDCMPFLTMSISLIYKQGAFLIAQKKYLKQEIAKRSKKINEQKIYFESLVNNNPVALVTMDEHQRIISINEAFSNLFQFTEEEVKSRNLDEIIAPDESSSQAYQFTSQILNGGKIHGIGKRRRKDGSLVDVEIYGVPIVIENRITGVLGMYIDITDRKGAEESIKKSELRFRSLFHDSPISMWELDFSGLKDFVHNLEFSTTDDLQIFLGKMQGLEKEFASLITIMDVNQATLQLFKADDLQHLKSNFESIFIDQSVGAIQHIIVSLYNGNHQVETEFTLRTLDNVLIHTIMRLSLVTGSENDWSRIYISILDITERKWAEERLRYLSMHDSMTGLYNRAYFENELGRLARGRTFPVSIIIGDLDNLKRVNDTYGHKSGDALICQTASILLDTFRGEDIIARLGGDEFAVIIPYLEELVIQKILSRLRRNITGYNLKQENPGMRINLSLGTATAEESFITEDLFKLADQRMYIEKNGKRKANNEQ